MLSSRFPFVPFLFTNHVSRNEQWNNFQKINETSHLPMPIIQYMCIQHPFRTPLSTHHMKGLSPVWLLRWQASTAFSLNTLPHVSQRCSCVPMECTFRRCLYCDARDITLTRNVDYKTGIFLCYRVVCMITEKLL